MVLKGTQDPINRVVLKTETFKVSEEMILQAMERLQDGDGG